MIDRDTVLHIAKLARLSLTEQELEKITVQLGSTLEYIDQLNRADTSNVEPTCFIAPLHDPLRDDTLRPSLTQQEVLQNGPSVKKGFFAIPKVIGG
jgi:aspartyl-tRNA(Asn)/glutamyl-tRNA(Gln) amidotransferase subunit C